MYLKISGASKNYRLKITIISKNYRLKITEWSKNYGLKIPVRVRAYARARMYARASEHQDTRPRPEHRTPTEREEKPAYIGMIAGTEKKLKKVKKNLEM